MPQRTKTETLNVVFDCAVQYKTKLEGKNILFVTLRNDQALGFETLFILPL